MSLFSNFATNSINILAGINGIEVSQALIIALSVALNDLLYLPWSFRITLQYHLPLFQQPTELSLGGVYAAGLSHGSKELLDRHLMSLYFMLPLIGVCLGFLYHNWSVSRFNTPSHRFTFLGILLDHFRVTPSAMSPACRSPLLASSDTIPKLWDYSSCPSSSMLS